MSSFATSTRTKRPPHRSLCGIYPICSKRRHIGSAHAWAALPRLSSVLTPRQLARLGRRHGLGTVRFGGTHHRITESPKSDIKVLPALVTLLSLCARSSLHNVIATRALQQVQMASADLAAYLPHPAAY